MGESSREGRLAVGEESIHRSKSKCDARLSVQMLNFSFRDSSGTDEDLT